MTLAFERLSEKYLTPILIVALLLVFFWLAFRWFSYFSAAQSAAAIPAPVRVDLATAAETIRANHLFKKPLQAAAAAPQAVATETPPLNVTLKGVFASTGIEPAYAIVNVEGSGDQAVKLGNELDDGVVLAEVHPAYVIVKRGGVAQEVALEEKFAPPVTTPRVAATPTFLKPSAQRKNGAAGRSPKAGAAPAVVNPAIGVKIDAVPQDGVAQRLGLKKGDVITAINGQVVASLDDLDRLHEEFSEVGQVILEGTRDGKPMTLNVE
ncbi:MAG: type II secretion system protein N [Burkholderiales bacterium]